MVFSLSGLTNRFFGTSLDQFKSDFDQSLQVLQSLTDDKGRKRFPNALTEDEVSNVISKVRAVKTAERFDAAMHVVDALPLVQRNGLRQLPRLAETAMQTAYQNVQNISADRSQFSAHMSLAQKIIQISEYANSDVQSKLSSMRSPVLRAALGVVDLEDSQQQFGAAYQVLKLAKGSHNEVTAKAAIRKMMSLIDTKPPHPYNQQTSLSADDAARFVLTIFKNDGSSHRSYTNDNQLRYDVYYGAVSEALKAGEPLGGVREEALYILQTSDTDISDAIVTSLKELVESERGDGLHMNTQYRDAFAERLAKYLEGVDPATVIQPETKPP